MAPVPESASKAVKLWTRSLEAGYEAQQMNRVDRIAHKATGQKHAQLHLLERSNCLIIYARLLTLFCMSHHSDVWM